MSGSDSPLAYLDRRAVLGGLLAAAIAPLASLLPKVTPPGAVPTAEAERRMRGMWISSVLNSNWPSRPGLPAAVQRDEFTSWMDLAVSLKLNSVFVQVRPTADAFWPSPYEPWSEYLTGVQGRDPGYDPLAFMVKTAHERGLAFHAWFNPYRVSMRRDPARLVPGHPLRREPSWGVAYGDGLYYNPGMPEVRAFVQDAIMDAVTRYDVDGLHFDDYFYPYPVAGQEFDDARAYAEHGEDFPDRAAWRRHNVDRLIEELAHRVRREKPRVQWGISPFGIWRNATTDPRGSDTSGSQSYDDQYADTRGWIRNGWLDYVVPQLYWNIGLPAADYAKLVPWWAEAVEGTATDLWIGQPAYRSGAPGEPSVWQNPAELTRHLDLNRDYPRVDGDVFYSAADLRADRLGAVSTLVRDHYARAALPPRPLALRARLGEIRLPTD
ncbi:glycoside hydrolase family 10 protein [Sphaerisporangium aureirubrum]|uniref:Glycoside hydrolase family 10 protein n=1 Tax=Sphaerisporangium aureirubrum TaxID=1544736 RepID=A0ABW1NI38_9ACTN